MGSVPCKSTAGSGCSRLKHSGSYAQVDQNPTEENDEIKRGASNRGCSSGNTVDCPTCQGTGRIPRGQESKLVAVIPCTDQRLRPRHTKCYVIVSVSLCLLFSSLVLFFLFPRAVVLSPVVVQSSFVHFTKDAIQINIMNVLYLTNHNFVTVQAYNLSVQALNFDTVVGTVSIKNITSVQPLSVTTYNFTIPIKLTDPGMREFCRRVSIPVHIVYLHLQMSMTVYYLAHYEQLSLDTYEFIDCGSNSTIPHKMLPSRP